jgi:hypothetical protein
MIRIKEMLGYLETIGFFASWFLILSGFGMYLSVRLGYQHDHNYALAGAIIIIPGAMFAMIIHFMRWQFAGKKWHLPFLLLAAFFFYESLELLHLPQIGLNPYEPMQEAATFLMFLFGLHIIRVVWVRYTAPDNGGW